MKTVGAIGVAIFSIGFNVWQSLWTLLSEVREGMKHDVQVVLRNQVPKDHALALFKPRRSSAFSCDCAYLPTPARDLLGAGGEQEETV